MGSFHVGGRYLEVKGQPIKEIVFTPGGVPAKCDPNGTYQVEQMYVQYFLVQNRKGKLPLLMWHGGGLTGVTYETKPDGGAGWGNFSSARAGRLHLGRDGARTFGWTGQVQGEPMFLPINDPWVRFRIGEKPSDWDLDPAKRKTYPGMQFPVEAYEQFMKQERAALADHR
jgi:hypothetical protein